MRLYLLNYCQDVMVNVTGKAIKIDLIVFLMWITAASNIILRWRRITFKYFKF